MKGHLMALKAKEGQGRSWKVLSHHWIDISGEKVIGGGGGMDGGL